MRRAIRLSERASIIERSGGPFGCVIVDEKGEIVGEGYNQVLKQSDPTWHAEIQAIREASKKRGTPDLKGCTLYSSSECCPMCICAIGLANIDQVFFGATIEDAMKYGECNSVGMNPKIKCTEFMREEAVEVLKLFAEMPNRAR